MARCCLVMQAGSSAGQLLQHLAEVAEVEDAGGAVVLLAEVEPLERDDDALRDVVACPDLSSL